MKDHPIPSRLNLILVILVGVLLLALLFATTFVSSIAGLGALAVAYAIIMNTGYALIHEAEHGLLHHNPMLNVMGGILLSLFFPAPYHLIRQGHIGHHVRNRSDDEAFDLYFDGDNPVWKWMQLFGILTGLFWVVIALSNFVTAVSPSIIRQRRVSFDRPTAAFQESLNPDYEGAIRWESIAVLSFHGVLIGVVGVPVVSLLVLLASFGFLWSTLQYVHHFGTIRDVEKGARNLRTFRWLDLIWLNHNWHLNHHVSPTTPWVYLPFLHAGEEYRRTGLLKAYLRMWRGPRFSSDRVENRHKGKIIR